MTKVSAFTFIYNGVAGGYPFVVTGKRVQIVEEIAAVNLRMGVMLV